MALRGQSCEDDKHLTVWLLKQLGALVLKPNSAVVPLASTSHMLHPSYSCIGNNRLPMVHRQSPCSPLHGLPSLTVAGVLRRDASLIRRHFSSQWSLVAEAAPSLAATIIPTNGSWLPATLPPGALEYSVLVSFGTPEQQFPMFLVTSSIGATLLQCKPSAFDTSQSSTFTHVLCGSPECPTNCSGRSVCPLDNPYGINGTFAEDVLTLAPSMAIHDFKFVCQDERPSSVRPKDGTLDMSRGRNSLPSQLSSSSLLAGPATFSYCLPQAPSSQGFLSLGGDYNFTTHASMVSSGDPELEAAGAYFIDLVGMSLDGEDLPIPAGTFHGNTSTNVGMGLTFSMLAPDAYTPLRDAFRKEMSQYNRSSPGFDGFDTCFNFTGLDEVDVPLLEFKFSKGDSLMIDADQMVYYDDPYAGPFGMTCLAPSLPWMLTLVWMSSLL